MVLKRANRGVFKRLGWTVAGEELKNYRRCVVLAAPHTSNWDFLFTVSAFRQLNLPMRFTIKNDWMKFPYSLLMNPLGGIGIDRSPRKEGDRRLSMVEAMTALFEDTDFELALVVTPEGTRSHAPHWKSGFYHVAMQAKVPILLGYLDYAKKEAGIGKVIHPTGDFESDMREIMAFYQNITPKHPERFAIDERYVNRSRAR